MEAFRSLLLALLRRYIESYVGASAFRSRILVTTVAGPLLPGLHYEYDSTITVVGTVVVLVLQYGISVG